MTTAADLTGAGTVESPNRPRTVDDDAPRRLTPTERLHEITLAALTHTTPASARPSFKVAQVKATGGQMVTEWDVYVPVCDEFPTAAEAFKAACLFADDLRDKYPGGNGPSEATGGPQ